MGDDVQDAAAVRLLELRVLDGANRFFNRPAVKLEFAGDEPGAVTSVAEQAAGYVGRLHDAAEMGRPSVARRTSVDGRREIVAFTWRRRSIGQAIGEWAARLALGEATWDDAVRRLAAVAPGPRPAVPRPRIPVIAVTGTNGKSTTTRLIAHIAETAGLRVGMTNSDGVYIRGELVEPGDWTGFGGATRVLGEHDLDLAVLETARGGVLLRGIGYRHNDVSVVTNISADHLGLHGIDTLDELAEVKGAIVRMTRRDGWAVLNADDPRVWGMRSLTRAHTYAFILEGSPLVDETVDRGGSGARLQDGALVLLQRGRAPHELVAVADLPVALGGLSRHNVANALAAAAAADAVGVDRDHIAAGLRSFSQDTEQNPGRLNIFALDGRIVVVDFAHNEAGLAGLLETARALARGGRLWCGLGTAGDRTDEMLIGLGRLAAQGADEVAIVEKIHYLRGRAREEMVDLFRRGVAEAGKDEGAVQAHDGEVAALQALLSRSAPGDVVAVMCHADRPQVFAWLSEAGAESLDAARIRRLAKVG